MSTSPSSAAADAAYQTIREGSVEMRYPADQESTVFYNPVQVQNRDLSILMITLAAEERAVRLAVAAKKKQLKAAAAAEEWKQQLQDYEQQLDPSQALADQVANNNKDDDNNNNNGMDILDALAASGLRSLRYWKEIPGIRHITINDLDAAAVERAHTNIQHNQLAEYDISMNKKEKGAAMDGNSSNPAAARSVPKRPAGICVQQGDAIHELYMSRKPASSDLPSAANMQPPWDVIDLDPYGSAAPFIDAAVQAVADGGLLCVTCTDMAALGGSHPETCFGRYASFPIQRAGYLQEFALRILLQSLATTAAKYGRAITPRLSVGMNFYIRVFVTVHESKAAVNRLSLQIGNVYQSTQCNSYIVEPHGQMGGKKNNVYQAGRAPGTCEETGSAYKVGGPIWLGPLHDTKMLQEALRKLESKSSSSKPDLKFIATKDRLRGLLQNCLDELPEVPLFYKLPDMAGMLKVSCPPLDDVRSALINAGYRVSGYHKEPQAIKTDAPCHVMWDILRAWCAKQTTAKEPPKDSMAAKIRQNESKLKEVDFSRPKKGLPQKGDVARFPRNPESNWGPKKAATGQKRKAESKPQKEAKQSDLFKTTFKK